jgi:hypothetical protein
VWLEVARQAAGENIAAFYDPRSNPIHGGDSVRSHGLKAKWSHQWIAPKPGAGWRLPLARKRDRRERRQRKNHYQSLWKSLCHPPPPPNSGQTISRGLAGAHVTAAVGMTGDRRQCS